MSKETPKDDPRHSMIKAPTNKRTSRGKVILRRNSETTTPRSISKNGTKPTRIDFVAGDQDRERRSWDWLSTRFCLKVTSGACCTTVMSGIGMPQRKRLSRQQWPPLPLLSVRDMKSILVCLIAQAETRRLLARRSRLVATGNDVLLFGGLGLRGGSDPGLRAADCERQSLSASSG